MVDGVAVERLTVGGRIDRVCTGKVVGTIAGDLDIDGGIVGVAGCRRQGSRRLRRRNCRRGQMRGRFGY